MTKRVYVDSTLNQDRSINDPNHAISIMNHQHQYINPHFKVESVDFDEAPSSTEKPRKFNRVYLVDKTNITKSVEEDDPSTNATSYDNSTNSTNTTNAHSITNHHLTIPSVSLSELDNLRRNTLDNFRIKFQTLNDRLRMKMSGKSSAIKKKERIIRKNGECNMNRINIESRSRKYIADLFNTIIDMKWRFILLVFICGFMTSWVLFGILWHIIQLWQPSCIHNVSTDSFFSSLLFSIETQQTIGYGSRYIEHNCIFGIVLVILQCCFSVLLQSFMGGIVFAKLSRPKKRTETLIFSRHMVIACRDGEYCLMCRVGDMRKTHILQAQVSMYVINTRRTIEGEIIPWNAQELEIGNRTKGSDKLLFMPIIVEHRLDRSSPLWNLFVTKSSDYNYGLESTTEHLGEHVNAKEVPCFFKNEDFEIVVILEGTVESTGATTQARTSYLPSEIQWNHVFEPLVDPSLRKATIDYSKFHLTKPLNASSENQTSKTIHVFQMHENARSAKAPFRDLFAKNNSYNEARIDDSLQVCFSNEIGAKSGTKTNAGMKIKKLERQFLECKPRSNDEDETWPLNTDGVNSKL